MLPKYDFFDKFKGFSQTFDAGCAMDRMRPACQGIIYLHISQTVPETPTHQDSMILVIIFVIFLSFHRATKKFSIHLRDTLTESWTMVKTATLVDATAIPFADCHTIPYETFEVCWEKNEESWNHDNNISARPQLQHPGPRPLRTLRCRKPIWQWGCTSVH